MTFLKPHQGARKNGESQKLRRNLLLGGVLALWMAGLLARLYFLQVVEYTDSLARAQRQQQRTVEIAPKRGTIFDREMQPLAMSLAVDSVFAVPAEISNPEMVAGLLAPVMGLSRSDLAGRFKAFRSFCWVKRKVSSRETARVRDLNLKGIYFQKEMKRFYPKGKLAAHVLGAVGLDDNGLAGLEYSMNDAIKGHAARVVVAYDARGQSFRSTELDGEPGKNVVLTLDENIQYIAEKALASAVRQWRAAWGTAIVQDPSTGAILAMASVPAFDPNEYSRSDPHARINRAAGGVFEPGSTLKLVPLAAALEERLTNPREVIDCQQGSIALAGHVIHDHKPFGFLTVEQVLAQSSDVGAIKLGLRLGEERLHRYMRDFGFGSKTEIELPGEERGLLKSPAHWSGISIGEISMGQEVGVTPLQLVTAYSAVANGGVLYQPRAVQRVFRESDQSPLPPVAGRRLISERTTALMKQIFQAVVESGTGAAARLDAYSAAGKTGTAQKIDASGRYSKTSYVSSFVGFAPVSRPAVTILVVIDSPVGAIYGAEVAAPVFRSIAEQTLGYLSIPQDNPSRWLQVASRAPAGLLRQTRGNRAGSYPTTSELTGAATSPFVPVSFSRSVAAPSQGTVVLDEGPLFKVPQFSHWPLRRVAEECQRLGLELHVNGTGLAVEQKPPPGARVREGGKVWVRFAR